MNLVGKIFVVFILVMALVFMAFAMAVYTVQRNWREVVMLPQNEVTPNKPLGLRYQLDTVKHDNEELKTAKTNLETQTAAEKAAQQQALTKLQTELDLTKAELKSKEVGRADLQRQVSEAAAALKATQTNATDYRQKNDTLEKLLLAAQKDRDEHLKEVVRKTNELNELVSEKELLRKRLADLSKDLAKSVEALRYFNINKDSDYKAVNPPQVDGIVTAVLENGLIQISLGSDHGLRAGHILQVYRKTGKGIYVGRVEVVKTDPSAAVCKVDPKFQNSNIMVNDLVTSKIQ